MGCCGIPEGNQLLSLSVAYSVELPPLPLQGYRGSQRSPTASVAAVPSTGRTQLGLIKFPGGGI
jgi:hypothetical protein